MKTYSFFELSCLDGLCRNFVFVRIWNSPNKNGYQEKSRFLKEKFRPLWGFRQWAPTGAPTVLIGQNLRSPKHLRARVGRRKENTPNSDPIRLLHAPQPSRRRLSDIYKNSKFLIDDKVEIKNEDKKLLRYYRTR